MSSKFSDSSEVGPLQIGKHVSHGKTLAVVDAGDAELLAQLGYKQELKRNFSTFEVFGIAFSIIAILPSIASTLSLSMPAGPVGMVWGWFVASGFIMTVYSGHISSHHLNGEIRFASSLGTQIPWAWWVAVMVTMYCECDSCLCSVDYGFSLMFSSVIVIARHGNWTPSNGTIYGVFLCTILCHALLATTLQRIINKLQTVSVIMNLVLIFANTIALPIGKHASRNDAKFIFTHTENLTTWPTAHNAAKAVPRGIISAIGASWLLGFLVLIVISSCMNPDITATLGSKFGQPMARIYFDALGKHGAMGFMALLFICQFQMGLSTLVAVSRQSWAFSRDGALPFSTFFRPISTRFPYTPVRTVCGCAIFGAFLGLLCLIAPAAANALFSLCVAGNNLAWATPIFCRIYWDNQKFKPGPFYTGRFSKPIAWVAVTFLAFGICLAMFPTGGPGPTKQDMNYTVVINMCVWGGSLLYYFVDTKKWFKGPKIREEGLEVEGLESGRDEAGG